MCSLVITMRSLNRHGGAMSCMMTVFNILLLAMWADALGFRPQLKSDEPIITSSATSIKVEKRLSAVEEILLETKTMVQQMKMSMQSMQQVENLLVLFLEEILLSVSDPPPSSQSKGGEDSDEAAQAAADTAGVDSAETTDVEEEENAPDLQFIHQDPLDTLPILSVQHQDANSVLRTLIQRSMNLHNNVLANNPQMINNAMAFGFPGKCAESNQNPLTIADFPLVKELHQAAHVGPELLPMEMSNQGDESHTDALDSAENQQPLSTTSTAFQDLVSSHRHQEPNENLANASLSSSKQQESLGNSSQDTASLKALQPANMEGSTSIGKENRHDATERQASNTAVLSLQKQGQHVGSDQSQKHPAHISKQIRDSRILGKDMSSLTAEAFTNNSSPGNLNNGDDGGEDEVKVVEEEANVVEINKAHVQLSRQWNSPQLTSSQQDSTISEDISLSAVFNTNHSNIHDEDDSSSEPEALQSKDSNQGHSQWHQNTDQDFTSSEDGKPYTGAENAKGSDETMQDVEMPSDSDDLHNYNGGKNDDNDDKVLSRENPSDIDSMQASGSMENNNDGLVAVSDESKMFHDTMPDTRTDQPDKDRMDQDSNANPAEICSSTNSASDEDTDDKENLEVRKEDPVNLEAKSELSKAHSLDSYDLSSDEHLSEYPQEDHTQNSLMILDRKKRQSFDDVLLYLLDDLAAKKESNKGMLNTLLQRFKDKQQVHINGTTGYHSNITMSSVPGNASVTEQNELTNNGDDERVKMLGYSNATNVSMEETEKEAAAGTNALQSFATTESKPEYSSLSTDMPGPSDQTIQSHEGSRTPYQDELSSQMYKSNTNQDQRQNEDKPADSKAGQNQRVQEKLERGQNQGDSSDNRGHVATNNYSNRHNKTTDNDDGSDDDKTTKTAETDADNSKSIDDEDDAMSQQSSSQESVETRASVRLRRSPYFPSYAIGSRSRQGSKEKIMEYALNSRQTRSIQAYPPHVLQKDPINTHQKSWQSNDRNMLSGSWNGAVQQKMSSSGGRDILAEDSGHNGGSTKRLLTAFLLALFGPQTQQGNGEEQEMEEPEEQAVEDSTATTTPVLRPEQVQTLQDSIVRFWRLLTRASEDSSASTTVTPTSPAADEAVPSSETESTSTSLKPSSFLPEAADRQPSNY